MVKQAAHNCSDECSNHSGLIKKNNCSMLWGFRHAIYLNNPSARQDTVLHPPFASHSVPIINNKNNRDVKKRRKGVGPLLPGSKGTCSLCVCVLFYGFLWKRCDITLTVAILAG